jgi:hypothetical protein
MAEDNEVISSTAGHQAATLPHSLADTHRIASTAVLLHTSYYCTKVAMVSIFDGQTAGQLTKNAF